MQARYTAVLALAGLGLACSTAGAAAPAAAPINATVTRVVDGDTIATTAGKVRLVQIDTPEVYGGAECYGSQASAAAKALLPVGTHVRLAIDPRLDRRDRYGRMLAYVWKGGSLVNLRLVQQGDAAPYFFSGDAGEYARAIFKAAVAARNAGAGLWGHCRGGAVPLRTNLSVATGPARAPKPAPRPTQSGAGATTGSCDPNYTGGCVPNVPYDLDCADIGFEVRVVGPDKNRFDGDGDGYGCESYG
jgi:endonuclease YncB( thermonuclease family)